jgi:NAD(P)-dependent dehydrogenase (short-subunit alcohol dehydrogenase family)
MKGDIKNGAIYPSLKNRVVFVTGGGSGIGESIVEHFCAQGAKVTFVDIAEKPSRALVKRIAAKGGSVPDFIPLDLRNIGDLQKAVAVAGKKQGNISVLVNNAAHDERHKIEDVTVEYWENRLSVNMRHQFFAAQAVRPMMKKAGGGSIINFGSISWMAGTAGYVAYATAKSSIGGLTRVLARELGPENIRVNCVVPGWVMTKRQMELWLDEEGEKEIDRRQCLRDRLQPPDLARMVLFLAADDSRMCTSQNFIVDAGWV